jgi:acetyl-CoA carboxylase biotin carboxyl carrier protein
MDIRKVKKLIELLEESSIAEIEIHEGEESVRVSRHGSGPVQVMQPAEAQAVPRPAAGVERPAVPQPPAEPEGHIVRAPMVGIFYTGPAPGRPPFVEIGQSVRQGEVVCIIEAMKIMNQIEADASGVIVRVLAENGDPVEYGQPLLLIRES